MIRTRYRPFVVLVAAAGVLSGTPAIAQTQTKPGARKGHVIQENGDPAAQVRVNFVKVDDPTKK